MDHELVEGVGTYRDLIGVFMALCGPHVEKAMANHEIGSDRSVLASSKGAGSINTMVKPIDGRTETNYFRVSIIAKETNENHPFGQPMHAEITLQHARSTGENRINEVDLRKHLGDIDTEDDWTEVTDGLRITNWDRNNEIHFLRSISTPGNDPITTEMREYQHKPIDRQTMSLLKDFMGFLSRRLTV